MSALRIQAAAGVRWTGVSSVVNALADIARIIVLARFLSPVDYGVMAMVWIVIGLAQIYLDLGISAAIVHRQDSTSEELSSLYWLNILVGLTMFGLVWLSSPWIPLIFREPRMVPLLRVTAMVFIIAPIGSQFEVLLQKKLLFKSLARWEITASVCSATVAIVCAVTGCGVWTLVWSFLTSVVIKTSLLAWVGFAQFRPAMHFRRSDLKGYIGFGLFQMGERTINYLAERLDQMLIGPLLGPEALGFYNFALYLTSQPISRINPILTKVAFPVFSHVQHDTERLRRGYIKLVSLIATVNAPLLVGLAAVAPWAVPTIFGAKWSASVILVQILCFVSLSRSIGNPIGSLQLARGRADLGFWWNLALFVFSVPAIYVGARIGHATGVAIGLLVLQVSVNVPSYLFMVRPLIGRCARDYCQATLLPVSLAVVMGLAVVAVPQLASRLPVRIEVAVQFFVGGLVYLTLIASLNKSAVTEFQSAIFSR